MRFGRALLAALLVASLVAAVAQPPAGTADEEPRRTAVADHHETASYVVEQNGVCRPIEPFDSGGTVASFYDYRSNATTGLASQPGRSSYGTESLQSANGSVLFLHEGSDGLSLGVVHGRVNGSGDGGRATMEFVGLPADAEWAVRDDADPRNDGTPVRRADTFTTGDGWASGSWSWRDGHTDGGALNGGFNGRFAVTVDPGVGLDRGVESLAVASGGGPSATSTTLPSLDAPFTIRTGTCDGASVRYDRTADGIEASVEGARADHPVALQPAGGASDNATFERVTVVGANGSFALGFGQSDTGAPLGNVDGADSLAALSMTDDLTENGANGTVTFSVSKDAFDPSARDDNAVVLYERVGEWRPTATELLGETADAYRFRANVSSFSAVAVAAQRSFDVTDVTLSETRIREGETIDVTATVENSGQFAGEYRVPLTVFGEHVDARTVSIAPGENRTVEYEQQFAAPGDYTVEVRDERAAVTVEARSDGATGEPDTGGGSGDDADALPGFGLTTVVVTLSVLVAVAVVRRRDEV